MTDPTTSQLMSGIDFYLNPDSNDIEINSKDDFRVIQYYNNLQQAIIDRLQTKQGEIVLHPNYGSQLHLLMGRIGNSLILSEAKQFVKEALLQEPRISKINKIKVRFKENSSRQVVLIDIIFTPIGTNVQPLNIVYSYFLTA